MKAFVVLEDRAAPLTPDDLRAHTHGHLARYKCPAEIEIVDELPHGPGGKLLRRSLRLTPHAAQRRPRAVTGGSGGQEREAGRPFSRGSPQGRRTGSHRQVAGAVALGGRG